MISKFLNKLKSILFKSKSPAKTPVVEAKKIVKAPKKSKTKAKAKAKSKTKTKTKKEDPKVVIESLKNLPGIGAKSAKAFYDAGFKTTKSIISAKDEDLLAIPGVGINLVKKLKKLK